MFGLFKRKPEPLFSNGIWHIGDKTRVEAGPRRLYVDSLTEDLISNRETAAHYALGLFDAAGNITAIGHPFTYLAWGGIDTPRIYSWYVYSWQEDCWAEVAMLDTEQEALNYAKEIA